MNGKDTRDAGQGPDSTVTEGAGAANHIVINVATPNPGASSKSAEQVQNLLLAEWKELRETLRYFGNKRFAQLTVFITANGFMINALFAKDNPLPGIWGGVFGLVFAILFGLHEVSSVRYFRAFAERGRLVEAQLGEIRTFQSRPQGDLGTMVTYGIYAMMGAWWVFVGFIDLAGFRPRSIHPQWAKDAFLSISQWLHIGS